MKKFFALFIVAIFINLIACGPSAEDKAKQEADAKAKMDSLFHAAGENMISDSSSMSAADTAMAH